ncbi:MAG: hypothetical protein RIQ94_161 [Pseudomonadota bacterium]|jgi:hypothetical protein
MTIVEIYPELLICPIKQTVNLFVVIDGKYFPISQGSKDSYKDVVIYCQQEVE